MTLAHLHRPLGNTGLQVSPLGLGIVKIGRNQGVKYPSGFDLPDDGQGRDLLALGLRGPAVGARRKLLLEAVLAEPQLNTPATLAALCTAMDKLEH